jgi:hypothetical protein
MPNFQNDPVQSNTNSTSAAVIAENTNTTPQAGVGVHAKSAAAGVLGESTTWHGVVGFSQSTTGGFGVYGSHLAGGTGVVGESTGWMGIYGKSTSTSGGAGVMGEGVGPGVIGKSQTWMGVYGETTSTTGGAGVWGEHKANGTGTVGKSDGGVGVWGTSDTNEGVHAETKSPGTAAVAAYNLNPNGTGAALFAKKEGNVGHAGFFDGDVFVTGNVGVGGDITLVNADCAEEFDIAAATEAESGVVMVLDEDAKLQACRQGYDRRVAGVVSGAGDYRPGIVLDKQRGLAGRAPIALLGKVFCKVDAGHGAIAIGDMLTTSPTPGHAMRADDRPEAFGAIIGKALRPWIEGCGLIPILVCLQ